MLSDTCSNDLKDPPDFPDLGGKFKKFPLLFFIRFGKALGPILKNHGDIIVEKEECSRISDHQDLIENFYARILLAQGQFHNEQIGGRYGIYTSKFPMEG
jgi:hypothetical protein